MGALGHESREKCFVPKKIDFFSDNSLKVESITAGNYHSVALTAEGHVYTWGRGLYGALGNGSNSYSLLPILNEEFKAMSDEGHKVVKMDAADDYTGVLWDNGELQMFGKNDRGQLGVGQGIGMDFVESLVYPQPVVNEDGEPLAIRDFHCGMNNMLV